MRWGFLVGSRPQALTALKRAELQILSQCAAGWLFNGVAGVSERDAGLIQHGDHAALSL